VKRSLLPLLFSIAVLTTPATACMNDYVPNVAAIERSKSVLEQLQKHTETEPWNVRRGRLRKELAAGGDYKVKNDLATALAHTGEAAEAVTLLEQIETEKPGLYVTAANLGTAYELNGNDEKALEWIKKGIERNPESHEGTEWLHVRILEAKLALKSDTNWLEANSILGPRTIVDPTDKAAHPDRYDLMIIEPGLRIGPAAAGNFAVTGNRGEKLTPEQIEKALMYQLHERLQFVKPPDAIVGDLLLELGHLLAKRPPGPGSSRAVYQLAAAYLTDSPNAESLLDDANIQARHAASRQRTRDPGARVRMLFFLAVAAIVLPFLVIGLKRRIERRLTVKTAQGTA
jgi:tetratricopeptide (TPR) repeat protein